MLHFEKEINVTIVLRILNTINVEYLTLKLKTKLNFTFGGCTFQHLKLC